MKALPHIGIVLAATLAVAGCSSRTTEADRAAPSIDPATGLVACPVRNGVLPSRGGEGVQQSPESLPPGFAAGSQRCIAGNNAAAALH
jgi:hypothetical protein